MTNMSDPCNPQPSAPHRMAAAKLGVSQPRAASGHADVYQRR